MPSEKSSIAQGHAPVRRGGTYLANIALSLVGIGIALALIEGGLRLMGLSYPLYPEVVEFAFPNERLLKDYFDRDRELFWVTRTYYERLDKAKGVDLVFMGDSCTENGDYDRFLSDRVSDRYPGRDISYYNSGTSGWTSYQGVQQLIRDIVPLKPKIVTFYYGWNDHWTNFGIADKDVEFVNDSALYTLLGLRTVQLGFRAWTLISNSSADSSALRVSPQDFEENLRQLIRISRRNGIIPVVLTAPAGQVEGREPAHLSNRCVQKLNQLIPIHEQYVSIARNVAEAENAILCDLANDFAALPRKDVIRKYFKSDGIHLLEDGGRKTADALFDCFERNGLFSDILRPADEVRQIVGYGSGNTPTRKLEATFPALPTKVVIKKATYSSRGRVRVVGNVLSTTPIDFVAVYIDGINRGSANYPLSSPIIAKEFPEYDDPSSGFSFSRDMERQGYKGHDARVEVISDSTVLFEHSFKLTHF